MEISENSENCLRVILDWRQVAERNWFGRRAEKVVEKPQGEGKAPKIGFRRWQSVALTADYIDLRGYEARYREDEGSGA